MHSEEYEKIKGLTYRGYCSFLQGKYRISNTKIPTHTWSNTQSPCTQNGLVSHHIHEDYTLKVAQSSNTPYAWQPFSDIVYCDCLEHLLLHVMICEAPAAGKAPLIPTGIDEIIGVIVPELNDLYSGWRSDIPSKQACYDLILGDKDVYLTILKRFKANCSNYRGYTPNCLYRSLGASFGLWSIENNMELFLQIKALS